MDPEAAHETAIDIVIESRTRELIDGFTVRRVLPHSARRMVGPFIFFDEMGPEILTDGKGLDVAPHPHIGLATVTYLFDGEIMHRDGLGTRQMIRPGEVNWMTAGRGIAHSERTPSEARRSGGKLFGIQTWVALPLDSEECEPSFSHYGAEDLPVLEGEGKIVRLIAGSLYGERSAVKTYSDMFYADVSLADGAIVRLPDDHEERAVFVVEGQVGITGQDDRFDSGKLLIVKPGNRVTVGAKDGPARLMLFGGEPMSEKRHIWWNFVSSSKERIEQAKKDWKEGNFAPVPDEKEFIPLPPDPKPIVARYP